MSTAENLDDLDTAAASPTLAAIEAGMAAVPVGTFAARAQAAPPAPAGEGQPLSMLLADTARLRGFDAPAGVVVHRCECSAVVAVRGDICAACVEKNSTQWRVASLAKAWRSIPAGWNHADLGSRAMPVAPELARVVRGWSRNQDPKNPERAWGNLLLCGRTGVGKSTVAIALAKRILRTAEARPLPVEDMAFAVGVRFVAARDLVADARSHPLGARNESPLFRLAMKASLLVLDEVGFEPVDAMNQHVQRLIDARYNAFDEGKRTVTTTGLTREQVADRYGAAALRKMGAERGVVVEAFA